MAASGTSTRTVDRALGLLAHVCDEGELTLSECARLAQLPPSTALRLLRTLEASGFVARDSRGGFRPGPRVIQLGASALGRQSLVSLAEPALQRIVTATGESTYLSIAGARDTAIYIAMVEGTHPVRHTSWVGRAIPATGLAVGAALAGQVDGFLAQRDPSDPDVTAIVAPIRRAGGVAGAISLLGPSYRIDDTQLEAFGRIVSREADALSTQFGAYREVTA